MIINSLEEINKVVNLMVPYCKKNVAILLSGDLGAGKTTFTKRLLKKLGVNEVVNSPTFVIMNQYKVNNLNINHVDAYRLNENEESDMYLEQFYNALNIIEWSDNLNIKYEQYFKIIKISIKIVNENVRKFVIEGV
ncbi:tRNA (adenosine(37)-N6)-threonylcarbamoyltransferase complex ATPase subunit type 1 TsaE [Spiroplasma tabanidicola]|uniref:tRNA threonylcarbamoyladenosine biosynthesis protein TsaE n=1 Tax=Spiroplasma tabanidicola TaxID=324079 RepID=A0A6I6C9P5_9MOLU|nr:tRNA (adenosine(37)-N6)-threonylcarbamoyltransferase complex ATPase subunit type 1 TsaE [Spiroplasma tabanidicola]QGS51621.1 tRNA threonylcarbamoyladenosine biosynthesis protein TsaE [Spiroplasma tabanidicola]